MESSVLNAFKEICGPKNCLTGDDNLQHHVSESRGNLRGETSLVLKPGSVEEVSAILKLAEETGTNIVPQGGHTGLVGGGIPLNKDNSIVVCLERMNAVRDLDLEGNTLTVDSGCLLQTVRDVAEENDRLFPLSLGSQGSCMIGGNISTNAGGTSVLAFGNTRDLVMGLEVVLPSGEIWNGLNRLKKNNTGYDLKNLFVGAEGTLGIVTGAVLKLFPKPAGNEVAYLAFSSPLKALEFFKHARSAVGSQLTGFELVPRIAFDFVLRYLEKYSDPMENTYPWYALVQLSSLTSGEEAREVMENLFESGVEKELVLDGAIASSISQQQLFWGMREEISIAQKMEGRYFAHDVSVPVAKVPELIDRGEPMIEAILPGTRMIAYGHMGDGNIHFNFIQPPEMEAEDYESYHSKISAAVYELVGALEGAISAEHGIGLIKRDLLAKVKDPIEMEMMRQIKRTLDPKNIMNPGKVVAL